jgi:outer membrane protein OmpA-like peptidoglycan-associated protein
VIANKGCPEIRQEVRAQIALAAKGINFETNSEVILSQSFENLDKLAAILNQYPEAKAAIEGHTDNAGNADANKDLSQRRASSVKAYLVSQGIAESRLTAFGYGMERPIADNRTAAGRAKNRRVDFVLSY